MVSSKVQTHQKTLIHHNIFGKALVITISTTLAGTSQANIEIK